MTNSCHSILFLTKYTAKGPSSRYRSYCYLPYLKDRGVFCEVSPLFDDQYLSAQYLHKKSSKFDIICSFLHRIRVLLSVRRFDLVVIEYEILPYFPAIFECLMNRFNVRYIVDYDDALFHRYDRHHNYFIRKVFANKIAVVMSRAAMVIVGNAYLAEYAWKAGAKRVEIIPTVIDLELYPERSKTKANDIFTIGWIGSSSTTVYLKLIESCLTKICSNGNTQLRLIGPGKINLSSLKADLLPWSEDTEVENIHSFDMGIMPLFDDSWAKGKCGFKLIQYMACGLPVVASPVGVNSELVEHGKNGFLASTEAEWTQAIEDLRVDSGLREKMGTMGRRQVEEQYCLQVTAPKLATLLKSVAQGV